jgi:hypothetical protein
MLHVRYVGLTKAKPIEKRKSNPLVREDVATARVQGLGSKRNLLAVNRQSCSNTGSNSEAPL